MVVRLNVGSYIHKILGSYIHIVLVMLHANSSSMYAFVQFNSVLTHYFSLHLCVEHL
jgi:hypothetical protein